MVSNYELIPRHELLSDSEAQKASKKFSVPLDKFPKILESDPQAIKLKAHAGQLIAIHRQKDDGTGEYLYYRFVVKG